MAIASNISNLQKPSTKTQATSDNSTQHELQITSPVRSKSQDATQSPIPTSSIQTLLAKSSTDTITPTPAQACKKEIAPVSITYPAENQTVSGSPVCIDLAYDSNAYCSMLWSYRLDQNSWSDYIDKSICIANMTGGAHEIDVKVKSIATSGEQLLKRTFNYVTPTTTSIPTPTLAPTAQPTASASASL
jgi:hypothetical protein